MPPVPAGNKHAERFWEARLRWSRCSETRTLSGAVPAAGGARGGGRGRPAPSPRPFSPIQGRGAARAAPVQPRGRGRKRGALRAGHRFGAGNPRRRGRWSRGSGLPAGFWGLRPRPRGAIPLQRSAPASPGDPEAEVSGGASPWQRAEAEGAALMAAAGGAALWRRLAAWLPRGPPGLAALLGRLSDRLSRGRDRRSRR